MIIHVNPHGRTHWNHMQISSELTIYGERLFIIQRRWLKLSSYANEQPADSNLVDWFWICILLNEFLATVETC